MGRDLSETIEQWRSQLLDTSKRNRLISLKLNRTGSFKIAHPDAEQVWQSLLSSNATLTFIRREDLLGHDPEAKPGDEEFHSGPLESDLLPLMRSEKPALNRSRLVLEQCLTSKRLKENHLLTELADKPLKTSLDRLANQAAESLSEQGVPTLFLAFGLLEWFASPESDVPILSPLLLLPVELSREDIRSPWEMKLQDEEVIANHTLAQLLQDEFKIRLPLPPEQETIDSPNWRTTYYAAVQYAVRNQPRWKVIDDVVLSIFSFQKIAMWEDLGKNSELIAAHPLCRAIAGDDLAQVSLPEGIPRASDLDEKTHPQNTFHILDCDSSQHEAIEAAKRGVSLILDGPPGTGKSQTIANIIAESVAAGKTVLFVSEKAAALEVVKRRLDDRNLGDFCLDCHSHNANKRQVITELGRCLSLPPEQYQDRENELALLFERRGELNAYVKQLHQKLEPLGLSPFEVQAQLSKIPEGPISLCTIDQPERITREHLRLQDALLSELNDVAEVAENQSSHPWQALTIRSASLNLRGDIERHFSVLSEVLGQWTEASGPLIQAGFVEQDSGVRDWLKALDIARGVPEFPTLPADWLSGNPSTLAAAYQELDSVTQEYRRAQEALPEFRPDALGEDQCPISMELIDQPEPNGFLPHGQNSLIALRDFEQVRLQTIQNLTHCFRANIEALDMALRSLGAKPKPLAANGIGTVTALLGILDGVGPLRPAWIDTEKRAEISRYVEKCLKEEPELRECRLNLLERMLPGALEPSAATVAAQTNGYTVFWKRFLPRWGALKNQIQSYYASGLPATEQLFLDMAKLAEYHRRVSYIKTVAEQFPDGLVSTSSGEIDWRETQSRLEATEKLMRLVNFFPELKQILINPALLDLTSFREAMGRLTSATQASKNAFQTAQAILDPEKIINQGQRKLSTVELLAWLEEQSARIQKRVSLLEATVNQLMPRHDLPLSDLRPRIQSLATLTQTGSRISQISKSLQISDAPKVVRERDWTIEGNQAKWLLKLLVRHNNRLPRCLVVAATDVELRPKLNQAIQQWVSSVTLAFQQAMTFLETLFEPDARSVLGHTIQGAPPELLTNWLTGLTSRLGEIEGWLKFRSLKDRMAENGLGVLLEEIGNGSFSALRARDAYLKRFYGSWLGWASDQSTSLGRFSVQDHERKIEEFRQIDQKSIEYATGRIRQKRLNDSDRPRVFGTDVPSSSELGILMREVEKKRRHLPLRQLFAKVPEKLLRLKPCLMMSPLAVSTYLDSPKIRFDLVIFDEASQVRPFDAICAIYRGSQLIVAGDQKQLPPTSFFERAASDSETSDDDLEPEDSLSDYDSILDKCSSLGMPRKRLRWHYRSRREGLIAFSNRNIYSSELVTFPSVEDTGSVPAVRFEHLPAGRWKAGGGGGFNEVEARRMAELIMEHFRHRGDLSLGVIAFSQRQQQAIQDEVEKLRRSDPSVEGAFSAETREPFFVKNLENVQGDERDVIFLSIGYGTTAEGRIPMRFGPLNRTGGERRLNVAVTRARQEMLVLASMRYLDIDLSKTAALGVKLMRAYLEYAERGVSALIGDITSVGEHDYDSPFEQQVAAALASRGLEVRRQVGCSGYRIDLALVDPKQPGRFLLGIECDGATYHSSATARDRDRLRQAVLENLGWRIVRIWSTDWVRDSNRQLDRVVAAYQDQQSRVQNAAASSQPPIAAHKVSKPASSDPVKITKSLNVEQTWYQKIEDVPDHKICELLVEIVQQCGSTPRDELIQSTSRRLGFQRTGNKIKAAIDEQVNLLLRRGQLHADDDRLSLGGK